jgi:hypothetical protein
MRAETAMGFHAISPLFFKEAVTCQHILAKLSKTPKYKISRKFIRRFYNFCTQQMNEDRHGKANLRIIVNRS